MTDNDANTDDEMHSQVTVNADEDYAEIEVVDEDPSAVVKQLLGSLPVDDPKRIYVEVGQRERFDPAELFGEMDVSEIDDGNVEPVEVELDDESEDETAEGSAEFTINGGTSNHAVASALYAHGPAVLSDITSRINSYPATTVSSTLTQLKDVGLVEREAPPDSDGSTAGRWSLTDAGYDRMREMGLHYEIEEDEADV